MAYWGYKKPLNFMMWILVIVLLVTGAIWLIVGGVNAADCAACRAQFGKNLTMGVDPRSIDNICNVGAYAFWLNNPEDAYVPDVRNNYYGWCILHTGPAAEIIAGGVMILLGLFLMLYFVFASPPGDYQKQSKAAEAPLRA
ncbi:hypothetical protein Vafri_4642 [Volvox africanus]|uniref:Uncharacterized protein n=1 Tax=Volvox africanus TaxID=51714 RepID=A0A8J4AV74_9CHLO|nr:hypothetical protein Vafri_4642 [Volvox africanus]